jgi:hypothetical protein
MFCIGHTYISLAVYIPEFYGQNSWFIEILVLVDFIVLMNSELIYDNCSQSWFSLKECECYLHLF